MSKQGFNRRDFLRYSAMGFGAAVVSIGLPGCDFSSDDDKPQAIAASFNHGVASGDPLHDRVILWTRVTPEREGDVEVSWQVALDEAFSQLITSGSAVTNAARDYTLKVDAAGLSAGTTYYYRFAVGDRQSPVGTTRTLPEGALASLTLALFSCSNYPAGHFHAYADAAAHGAIDAAVHVGDYIYEYGRGGYASEQAAELGREVLPAGDLVSLDDYRQRYAQYRSDANLQAAHARMPFIVVWDDHEVANDTWREGAENHDDSQGDFDARRQAAFQAYFEWLPLRPAREGDNETIYRSFQFGDLVALHMLDTRQIGRDLQLDYATYMDPTTGAFNGAAFTADVSASNRSILGTDQLGWLQAALTGNSATWQVLGQQVVMGRMLLPAAIATQQMSIADYAELGALAQLAARAQAGDPTLTADQLAYLAANAARLTPEVLALLQLPAIPYNLDAWDGYAYEREVVLQTAQAANANLVVLSGDTHNSWGINLTLADGTPVGVEFAGTSVSSPGLEYYLNLDASSIAATEAAITGLVPDLQYCNLLDRGYLLVHFTPEAARAEWRHTSSVKQASYSLQTNRGQQAQMLAGERQLQLING